MNRSSIARPPVDEKMSAARLARLYLRVNAMNELQYRANFFVQVVESGLALGTGLFALALVFGHTAQLGGWSHAQLLAVMGVYTLVYGVVWTFIQPNMQKLMEDIRLGTLDFTLTKPADAQVLVSVRHLDVWHLLDVVLGAGVLAAALVQLRSTMGIGQAAAFVTVLALGMVTIYCFWLAITTAVFWVVRLDELANLFEGVYRAGQYPVGIYPTWLRYGLTFLVPVAFAVTVPAEALTGRLTGRTILLALAVCILAFVLTRWFFRRGVRRYAGASA
jgi:ABC-2 type transport system permease protein